MQDLEHMYVSKYKEALKVTFSVFIPGATPRATLTHCSFGGLGLHDIYVFQEGDQEGDREGDREGEGEGEGERGGRSRDPKLKLRSLCIRLSLSTM